MSACFDIVCFLVALCAGVSPGAGVGLTAHALQKAVAGATFGSKTDVVVKGNGTAWM